MDTTRRAWAPCLTDKERETLAAVQQTVDELNTLIDAALGPERVDSLEALADITRRA